MCCMPRRGSLEGRVSPAGSACGRRGSSPACGCRQPSTPVPLRQRGMPAAVGQAMPAGRANARPCHGGGAAAAPQQPPRKKRVPLGPAAGQALPWGPGEPGFAAAPGEPMVPRDRALPFKRCDFTSGICALARRSPSRVQPSGCRAISKTGWTGLSHSGHRGQAPRSERHLARNVAEAAIGSMQALHVRSPLHGPRQAKAKNCPGLGRKVWLELEAKGRSRFALPKTSLCSAARRGAAGTAAAPPAPAPRWPPQERRDARQPRPGETGALARNSFGAAACCRARPIAPPDPELGFDRLVKEKRPEPSKQ